MTMNATAVGDDGIDVDDDDDDGDDLDGDDDLEKDGGSVAECLISYLLARRCHRRMHQLSGLEAKWPWRSR